MKLEFDNVHFDGKILTKWDVILRIVGDIRVHVGGQVVYREVEFCLVEFAVALGNWFVVATDMGPDFIYTSIESETEGLIRFTRVGLGSWRVSAADQEQEALVLFATEELKNAAIAYIRDLRCHLQPEFDILSCIEESEVRKALQ
jgi:hypothetical protein